MGEPFDGVRNSTVGAEKMVLEVRQTTTKTLDLQRAKSSSLMERVVWTAAAEKTVVPHISIRTVVAANSGNKVIKPVRFYMCSDSFSVG
jgi:hypothetical protein